MTPEHGSFRDASNRIFYHDGEVFRSLSAEGIANWDQLRQTVFFKKFLESGAVIGTETKPARRSHHWFPAAGPASCGTTGAVHLLSYEWTFGCDSALALSTSSQAPRTDAEGYPLLFSGAVTAGLHRRRRSSRITRDPGSDIAVLHDVHHSSCSRHRDIQLASLCRASEGIDPQRR
jgi:hypothetical protein